ncbi:unnamed protein product [Adineta ricciae]|uniref:G-protein coupled receptors family 1 profile domain-containing protein n=1 Tax=Adineta ricciae TaxID=249248 RepID=A0A815MEL8_ADIRI|nr:unnamed protein product [Adineta ricciae]
MSLLYVSQQTTIYAGCSLAFIGILGNSMNILVFSTVPSYRTTSCTFYFLISSIFNIAYIVINLISRIVSAGFGIDPTRTSLAWCKTRQFCLFTLSLVTITCSCLATIDQYFASSQNVRIRRWSNIRWARRIVVIIIIIWCIHGIPPALYSDISPTTKACGNMNARYADYIPFYLLGLICAIPIVVMVTFGYLTYRNIHLTRTLARQYADRQLVRMVLFQIILVIISFVPYGTYSVYSLVTTGMAKDTYRLLQEAFAITVLSLVPYFYYCGSCYAFLMSSSRFRRSVRNQVLFWRRAGQVIPFQSVTHAQRAFSNKTY